MLVDDSNSIAMADEQMLKRASFDVIRAEDGQDAISKLNKSSVDLMLLDWNMPNMDGIEFLKYNSENKVMIGPIIMMTTENKPEKIMQALKYGAAEYIMKPFTEDVLLSKIDLAFSGRA